MPSVGFTNAIFGAKSMGNVFCLMIGFDLSPPTFGPDCVVFDGPLLLLPLPPVPPLSGELIAHFSSLSLCDKFTCKMSFSFAFS